jgi:GTPase SAR1 family protein
MVCGATLDQVVVKPPTSTTYSYSFNVLFLGDEGVGKTSLIKRLAYGGLDTAEGLERGVEKTFEFDELSMTLAMSEKAYEVSRIEGPYDLAVIVFDLSRRNTFLKTLRYARIVNETSPRPQLLIVGNKRDLFPRSVNYSESLKTAAELGADYVETSALTGEGLKKLQVKILKRLISQRLERLKEMTK